MPFAVSVLKEIPYRDTTEEFSNVYQYGGANPPEGDRAAFMSAVANEEKGIMSQLVTFLEARMWEIGGTAAENDSLGIVDLSGTGSLGTVLQMPPEAAVLVQARSSRESIDSRPVYFRKWWHGIGSVGAVNFSGAQVQNQDPLTTVQKDALVAAFGRLAAITVAGVEYVMQSTNGGVVQLPATAYDWVEHRQFRA